MMSVQNSQDSKRGHRFGLNSLLNFSKNEGSSLEQNRKALELLFEALGIDSQLVQILYENSNQHLDRKAGVLLQFFDTSTSPYSFGNAVSYASYPNGFIVENRLLSEYFLDRTPGEFPQEIRLLLHVVGVLNPSVPMQIKRYTKIQPGKLKAWEQTLRVLVKSTPFDPVKRNVLRQALLRSWSH